MGKYTEALRKIEEERTKKIQDPDSILSKGVNLKSYAIGIAVAAGIVILLVYAYGVYRGSRSKEAVNDAQPIPEVPPPPPDEHALLLENVEKMMQLSMNQGIATVSTSRPSPEPPPAEETTPMPVVPEMSKDFYTVQVAAFEQEQTAKNEAQKLVTKGYKPLILKGTGLFKLCIGKFPTKEEADAELLKIKSEDQSYHEAFSRLVKRKKPDLT